MRTRCGRTVFLLGLGLALAGLAGCAGKGPPKASMALADKAINQAQENDAASYAPVEMQTAQQEMQAARTALDHGKYDEARRQAQRAEVDARLAEARSRTAQTRKITKELQESIATLRQEIERRQNMQK